MNLLLSFFVFAAVVFAPTSSFAKACYTPIESEAEQGIRIHSELMVIALNCAHMSNANGKNLYLEHKKFTAKHERLFATYEKILMNYMRNNNNKNPEKAMHKLRTDFANRISNDAAEMRPDIFCKTFAQRIEKAAKMDEITLRKWAATHFPGHEVSKPLCEG